MLRLLSQPLELGKPGLLSGAAVCWVRLPALRIYHMFHRALWRNAGLAAKAGLCLGFLPWIVLIVGLTGASADGSKLIEGNKSPGPDSIQVTLGGPVSSARLGELLAIHLERAFEQCYFSSATTQQELRHEI